MFILNYSRDRSLLGTFAVRHFSGKRDYFLDAYKHAVGHQVGGYLVVDCNLASQAFCDQFPLRNFLYVPHQKGFQSQGGPWRNEESTVYQP